MADAIAAAGEAPLDVEVRAADTAGAALQAAFMIDRNTVAFLAVDISRAKI